MVYNLAEKVNECLLNQDFFAYNGTGHVKTKLIGQFEIYMYLRIYLHLQYMDTNRQTDIHTCLCNVETNCKNLTCK